MIGESGSTDTLSTLPLVACCAVAVVVLIAAMGRAAGGGSPQTEELTSFCNELIENAEENLTGMSEDGRLYLNPGWTELAAKIVIPENSGGVASLLVVRILGKGEFLFPLSGNISGCSDVVSATEPFMLVEDGVRLPGELIAEAGR
jgi:hypothetical protein